MPANTSHKGAVPIAEKHPWCDLREPLSEL
jgi:hypothetical protein